MIKVRRRKCVLPQGGLDPCIMQYIDAASLTGLFKVPDMEVDHTLITALVKRGIQRHTRSTYPMEKWVSPCKISR